MRARAAVPVVVEEEGEGRPGQNLRRRSRPLPPGIIPRYVEGGRGREVLGAIEMSIMGLEGSWWYPVAGFILTETVWRRGYHALHSSFGKVFNLEKRWKIIREMGSGAYGFVVFVVSPPLDSLSFLFVLNPRVRAGRPRTRSQGRSSPSSS